MRRGAEVLVVLALAMAFVLLGATSAHAITRTTVLARAQVRVDHPVTYSQTGPYYAGYRRDCSGYASMCWATGTSWATSSFYHVTHSIPTTQLAPGDALLKKGYHIRIFYGWVDDAHTQYVAYESSNGKVAGSVIHRIADDLAFGYKPTRYDRISGSVTSRNLLKNGSFDVWAKSLQTWRSQPVWWAFAGSRDATLTVQRHAFVKATYSSAQLMNPSTSAKVFTDMSQEVTITPETTYTAAVWVRTAAGTGGVEVHLDYRDATGRVIATERTVGAASTVGPSAFRQISTTAVSPSGAVRAIVTVRLAGGTTAVSTTQTVSGTSAVFDEISLVRPRATISIKSSAKTSYIGRTVTVSGSVTPTAAIGTAAVIYVHTPGGVWARKASRAVYASGGGAAWAYKYTFHKGSRKGTYSFKAEVPAFAAYPGWLGSGMSSTVSVTLK
jgi:hypothetical protein